MARTADEIMLRMGFPADETGPFVTRLRASIAKRVERGLVDHSGGTWAPGRWTCEERAKALLGWEWAQERGHSALVELFDPIEWHEWRKWPAWFRDMWRDLLMQLRVARDRYILRRKNPYLP